MRQQVVGASVRWNSRENSTHSIAGACVRHLQEILKLSLASSCTLPVPSPVPCGTSNAKYATGVQYSLTGAPFVVSLKRQPQLTEVKDVICVCAPWFSSADFRRLTRNTRDAQGNTDRTCASNFLAFCKRG